MGSLYKIIAKLLANKLKRVVRNLVSRSQTTFVSDRHIQDGIVVLKEIVDLEKRQKRKCLLLRVDFKKAYDNINWGFLKYVLKRSDFGERWLKWMDTCIFHWTLSVIVNGSPTSDFVIGKCLKQGGPLSSFLFSLVAEGLAKLMSKAMERGAFKGFKVNGVL